MKNASLLTLFSLFFLPLFAQKKPNEIEQKGQFRIETFNFEDYDDSLRVTYQGAMDTILMEYFSQNGQIERKVWRDSLYGFYRDGSSLWYKYFRKTANYFKPHTYSDSAVYFNRSGQIRQTSVKNPKTEIFFDDFGQIVLKRQEIATPSVSITSWWQQNGKKVLEIRRDTLTQNGEIIVKTTDRLFFPDGKLKAMSISSLKPITKSDSNYTKKRYDEAQQLRLIRLEQYDESGKRQYYFSTDSLRLEIFKDNIDCFYGFKNQNGDTVIAPKYDRIEDYSIPYKLYAAYEGSRCTVFREDGSILNLPKGTESFESLGFIEKNRREQFDEEYKFRFNDKIISIPKYLLKTPNAFFFIKINNKIAVVNQDGQILIPPQYEEKKDTRIAAGYFREPYSMAEKSNQLDFIIISELNEKTKSYDKSLILNLKGEQMFGEKYEYMSYSGYKDLFVGKEKNTTDWALINSKGQVQTTHKNGYLKQCINSSIFVLAKDLYNNDNVGLYDAEQNKWLLDTLNFQIRVYSAVKTDTVKTDFGIEYIKKPLLFFTFQDKRTKKMGLLDSAGRQLLAPEFDVISSVESEDGLFIVKKGQEAKVWDFFNPEKKRVVYEDLSEVTDMDTQLLAKKNGKWGVVDNKNDQVLLPFEYDYANFYERYSNNFYLIKNGQAYSFTNVGFPKATRNFKKPHTYDENIRRKVWQYHVVNDYRKVFFTNNSGRVLLPPQYFESSVINNRFVIIKDNLGQRQIVFLDSFRVVNVPDNLAIEKADSKSNLILVSDTTLGNRQFVKYFKQKKFGVASTTGKLLTALDNYFVAIGDPERGTFFAKKDTPNIKKGEYENYCPDTLTSEDSNWQMFDSTGTLLDPTPLRFPIVFREGVGVGMKGDLFGIFRSNGSVVQPPQYQQAWRDDSADVFVCFKNFGINSSFTLLDKNGKTVVPAGKYDGISAFLGGFALVSAEKKIGLIDKTGREIITPQDLLSYEGCVLDSHLTRLKLIPESELYNANSVFSKFRYIFDNEYTYIKLSKPNPDSLKLAKNIRNSIWNLVLLKDIKNRIQDGSKNHIQRKKEWIAAHLPRNYNCEYWRNKSVFALYSTTEKTISFSISSQREDKRFHSFLKQNDGWREVNPLFFWKNDDASRTAFYTLLVEKIRAIKDADIDCGNSATLIERAQKQFLLSDTGAAVFLQNKLDPITEIQVNYQKITFTADELKPFVKM